MATTRYTNLAVGTSLLGSLAALFVTGSVITQGPRVVDNSVTNVLSDCYGSGCTVTQECETGVSRTGCTAAQSGGLATSNTCVITNPFNGTTVPFTGTGYATNVQVDFFKNPTASPIDAGPVSATTASSSLTVNSVLVGSGKSMLRNTGAWLVPQGGAFKITATKAVTTSSRMRCRATFVPIRQN